MCVLYMFLPASVCYMILGIVFFVVVFPASRTVLDI